MSTFLNGIANNGTVSMADLSAGGLPGLAGSGMLGIGAAAGGARQRPDRPDPRQRGGLLDTMPNFQDFTDRGAYVEAIRTWAQGQRGGANRGPVMSPLTPPVMNPLQLGGIGGAINPGIIR